MKDWIILDSGSTVNLFSNPDLVNNIRTVSETMELTTNTGSRVSHTKADELDYGEVRYDSKAITNIFSLKEMIKKH